MLKRYIWKRNKQKEILKAVQVVNFNLHFGAGLNLKSTKGKHKELDSITREMTAIKPVFMSLSNIIIWAHSG